MKRLAFIVLLFIPILLNGQGRGLNDRITNDLSRLPAMDAVVDSFMNAWSLRGVSLSVMRNDSLVFSKGYGWADREKKEYRCVIQKHCCYCYVLDLCPIQFNLIFCHHIYPSGIPFAHLARA